MRAINLRGEGATYECPACHEQHQSVMRLSGTPVLVCPQAPDQTLHLFTEPAIRRNAPIAFIVGPTPEPAERPEPVPSPEPEPVEPVKTESRQRRTA